MCSANATATHRCCLPAFHSICPLSLRCALQEIDAYWLQRRISKAFGDIDPNAAQKLAEDVFEALQVGVACLCLQCGREHWSLGPRHSAGLLQLQVRVPAAGILRLGRLHGGAGCSPPCSSALDSLPGSPLQLQDPREVENRLVVLLDFERFELIKELLKNRLRVVWCMRLARAEVGAAITAA